MTQIKIFTETTYRSKEAGPNAPLTDDLQKKVNDFLAENADKITFRARNYAFESNAKVEY